MPDESASKPPKRKADECPWYLLATLHGAPDSDDKELKKKNRVAWNKLMVPLLSEDDRVLLVQKGKLLPQEKTGFTTAEMNGVQAAFAHRRGPASTVPLPELTQGVNQIDFSQVHFDHKFLVDGFLFPTGADFRGATFSDHASFEGVTFSDSALFEGVTFWGWAGFKGVTFSRSARFDDANFSSASFWGATFAAPAVFSHVTFSSAVLFADVTFSSVANFSHATFCSATTFRPPDIA
jgi:hypothetical protein